MKTFIKEVKGRQILDSRGNPTVEAQVELYDGSIGMGAAPSGASTGKFEALELRDGDMTHYDGKGVEKAVTNINSVIHDALKDKDATNIREIDEILVDLDGTADKSVLGANAILAVSLAVARAAAKSQGLSLYRYLGGMMAEKIPVPLSNILNGGCHASNNIDIQEFMIMPVGACCFKTGIRWCAQVYHTLGKLLKERGLSTTVGDEGGFAPNLAGNEAAIELILEAIEKAGFYVGRDFVLAIDAAASEWKSGQGYLLPKSGQYYTTDQLIDYWKVLCDKYPIASIEDPLSEEDWDGWKKITVELGGKVQLVGDDLFVTNTKRLEYGIVNRCGNSILIKLNQIGTVSETLDAIKTAHRAGYSAIISHRSGETEDTFIADLSVAVNAGQIKTGAPCRSERTGKYNQLIRIEEEMNGLSEYVNPFI